MVGKVGESELKSIALSFFITFKNPCYFGGEYVRIVTKPLADISIPLYETGEYVHEAFVVQTSPIVHDLCGEVAYESRL